MDPHGNKVLDISIKDENVSNADIHSQWLSTMFTYDTHRKTAERYEVFLNLSYTRNQVWHPMKEDYILPTETWLV